jgi:hypothetical protein
VLTPAAQANLLSNGSSEAVVVTAADSCDGTYPWCNRSATSTPGWVQTGDGVDLIHNAYTQPAPVLLDASDGLQFLDMNQNGALGGIEQVVSVVAGMRYELRLDTAAWAENARGGTIGYALRDGAAVLASDTFSDPTGGTWVARNQAGVGLDQVTLMALPVPEPAPAAMCLAGLLVLAGLRDTPGQAAPRSRCSQARARAQSRLTVGTLTPSSPAISSCSSPPKNFSSTTLAARASMASNASSASCTRTTSTAVAASAT